MKILLLMAGFAFLAALLAGPAARAQDDYNPAPPKADPKMAALYDEHCMNTVYPDLSPRTREEFCACTAAQINTALTPAEQATMATGKGVSIDQTKLALKVMAPCLAPPVEEKEYKTCLSDASYLHYFKTREAFLSTCHCLSSSLSNYVQQYGPDLMAYRLAKIPVYADDPEKALTGSADYQNERGKWYITCLGAYAHQ